MIRKVRDIETEVMKDVPGWKTGTYYGEPVYYHSVMQLLLVIGSRFDRIALLCELNCRLEPGGIRHIIGLWLIRIYTKSIRIVGFDIIMK